MNIIPINIQNVEACHRINEENTPEVGTKTLKGLQELLKKSDYALCAVVEDRVVGFVICFQDTDATITFMNEMEHKNFKEINNRINNFLYIDRIAVDENYRNQSIGSMLYKEVVNFAEKNSIAHLTAEINLLPTKNIPSFLFHEKFIFTELDNVKYSEDYEVSLQVRINN